MSLTPLVYICLGFILALQKIKFFLEDNGKAEDITAGLHCLAHINLIAFNHQMLELLIGSLKVTRNRTRFPIKAVVQSFVLYHF